MSRQNVPENIAIEVLAANHHTCCICRERRKHVQIHHIDGDPSNNDPENLAVVCLDDHSRVTGNEGLGRSFKPGEVAKYKRQWEGTCRAEGQTMPDDDEDEEEEDEEDEEDVKPLISFFQSRRIKGEDSCAFMFDMEEGQQLVASISADGYVDVSICTPRDYQRWLDGKELMEYEGDEEVRECELPTFTAPQDGKFAVAIMNEDDEDVDVTVDISIWSPEDDDGGDED
jgi:hypothetical protein